MNEVETLRASINNYINTYYPLIEVVSVIFDKGIEYNLFFGISRDNLPLINQETFRNDITSFFESINPDDTLHIIEFWITDTI